MTVVSISSILDSTSEDCPSMGQLLPLGNPARVGVSAPDRSMHVMQKFVALGEMTGGIAHDFRNILAVLEAGLRLAEQNLDRPESIKVYIAASREALRRGSKLTAQLMDFARCSELEVCGGNANEYLNNLEPLLRFSAGPANPISIELQRNLPSCLINRTQFDVAVLNLVNNSRDASPDGGDIRITTELYPNGSRSYVRVRVADHGSGMSPEVLSRIFDPFFTTKGEQGTGIGLPQIQTIMKLIGGYVSVTSELGNGTAVDLMFPIVDFAGTPFELI
jgi:signal transduction histidine kinase